VSSSCDAYALAAEFYDLLTVESWKTLGPALGAVLQQAGQGTLPVLDIGSGTGRAIEAIAEACPVSDIIAIEPSRAMRAVLHAKLVRRPDLWPRVTVLPCTFGEAALPNQVGTAVALGMLGHLAPNERMGLLTRLAERLPPQGIVVLDLQEPARPMPVAKCRAAGITLGAMSYEGWYAAIPTGDQTIQWTMTYSVRGAPTGPVEYSFDCPWWTVSFDQLQHEARAAGLSAAAAPAGLIVLTKD
jgi:SAM-dependent methyltransferase